jgi:hypothetical protein
MVSLKPFRAATVTTELPEAPTLVVTELGLAEMLKSTTVTVMEGVE